MSVLKCLVLSCLLAGAAIAQPDAQPASTDLLTTEFVQPNLGAKLDKVFTRYADLGFSGTVIVGWGGLLALHKSYGFADLENEAPSRVDTVFPIGSITKQFTAAAILLLEMDGLLKTTDAVSNHIGTRGDAGEPLTIHDVLIDGDKYNLLAEVIEEVSGLPYEAFIEERLFKPATMKTTFFANDSTLQSADVAVLHTGGKSLLPFLSKLPLPRHAVSIFRSAVDKASQRLQRAPGSPQSETQRGAAGIYCTAADLFRWELALRGKRILSEDARKKFFEVQEDGRSYGWNIEKTKRGTDRLTVGGKGEGYESCYVRYGQYLRYVKQDLIIVALVNNDMGWGRLTWSTIESVAYGEDYSMPFAVLAIILLALIIGGASRRAKRSPRSRKSSRPRATFFPQ